jgi:ribose 5-phosphate isomerase RpiB
LLNSYIIAYKNLRDKLEKKFRKKIIKKLKADGIKSFKTGKFNHRLLSYFNMKKKIKQLILL